MCEWRELDSSWSARLDACIVDHGRVRKGVVSVFALATALVFFLAADVRVVEMISSRRTSRLTLASARAVGLNPESNVSAVKTTSNSGDPHTLGSLNGHGSLQGGIRASEYSAPSASNAGESQNMEQRPMHSSVQQDYARLASLYLKPFSTIPRRSYMDILESSANGTSDTCSGCFLLQIKNGEVWAYDPQQVRSKMAEFRELRMREAVYWATQAAKSGAVNNTEFVVSTTDCVVTTSLPHSYRLREPDAIEGPIFTLTHCNVSTNIPFPVVVADLMRRAFPEKFWKSRQGSLSQWDEIAQYYYGTRHHQATPWSQKLSRAVFRGSIRIPAFLKDAASYDKHCIRYGRTALHAIAQSASEEYEKKVSSLQLRAWRILLRIKSLRAPRGMLHSAVMRIAGTASPNSSSKTGTSVSDVPARDRTRIVSSSVSEVAMRDYGPPLDVKLAGKCGDRRYKSDKMNMAQQAAYKYTVYAEGNGFWADRLVLQLFGGSAIIKQATPCGMFFEPLLRAYEHYIPVDYYFRDIVRQVRWARANDAHVRRIVKNARDFAASYLTVSGIQTYTDELLAEYSKRLEHAENITIHPYAVKLYPAN